MPCCCTGTELSSNTKQCSVGCDEFSKVITELRKQGISSTGTQDVNRAARKNDTTTKSKRTTRLVKSRLLIVTSSSVPPRWFLRSLAWETHKLCLFAVFQGNESNGFGALGALARLAALRAPRDVFAAKTRLEVLRSEGAEATLEDRARRYLPRL